MPRYVGIAVFILIAALATAGWWLPSSEAQAQTLLNLTYSWSASPDVGTFVHDGLATTTTTASVTVQANQAPAFAHTEVTLTILEGQGDGIPIASPVTAVDPDGDELTYTLGGADASSFEVANNGQITVGPGVFLVQSVRDSYTVTLTATDDNGATDSTTVTILVVARGAGLEPRHQPPVPTSLSAFICIGGFPGCPDTFVFLLPTLLVGYMAVQKKRQQLKRVEVMGGVWVVCFLVLAIGTQIPVLRIIAYFMAAVAVGLVYMGVRR